MATWTKTGSLRGPQGLQGPQGVPGSQGVQGPAGPGLPAGGAVAQVPTKKSTTDYDVQWSTLYARAKKVANTARTSTVTLAADPDLIVPLAASTEYSIEAFIVCDGAVAGDLKFSFTAPAGATGWLAPLNAIASSVTALPGAMSAFQAIAPGNATGITVGMIAAGTVQVLHIAGTVVTGATAGNLTFTWAQGTSSTTATTVYAGSMLQAVPL